MKFKTTKVFADIDNSVKDGYNNIILQGGTRSSKTFSLCQWLIYRLTYIDQNKTVHIVRKTLPSLRRTVMKDFFKVLHEYNLYNEKNHNKSDCTYQIGTNTVEFFSVDDEQKVRGNARDILWLNEANEIGYDSFNQLSMRTKELIFADFNPSDNFHWLYSHLIDLKDSVLLKSTYLDNPFLTQREIDRIERYKETDQNYWRIYGLGLKGFSQELIYSHWETYKELPQKIVETTFGIDWGFNHPFVLMEVNWTEDGSAYCNSRIYESSLTNQDIINKMNSLNISRTATIYCDSAEPKSIEDLYRAGFNVKPADKSVKDGIDKVKTTKIFIHEEDVDTQNEIIKYKWKVDKNGKTLDVPSKEFDDSMDAMRYAIYNHKFKKYSGQYVIL